MELQNSKIYYLTLKEAADLLMVSPVTVSRLIKNGQLEAYRFGRQFRISKEALEQYIKQQRIK